LNCLYHYSPWKSRAYELLFKKLMNFIHEFHSQRGLFPMLLLLVTLSVQKIKTAISLKRSQSEAANSGSHTLFCHAPPRFVMQPRVKIFGEIVSSYRDRVSVFSGPEISPRRGPKIGINIRHLHSTRISRSGFWALVPKETRSLLFDFVPARAVERFRFRWKNFLLAVA